MWAKKRFCTVSKISPGALRSLLEATAARAFHPSLVRKGQSHPTPLPQLPLLQHTSSSACLRFSHRYPETSSPALPDCQMASGTTTLPHGSKHRTGLLFSEDQVSKPQPRRRGAASSLGLTCLPRWEPPLLEANELIPGPGVLLSPLKEKSRLRKVVRGRPSMDSIHREMQGSTAPTCRCRVR